MVRTMVLVLAFFAEFRSGSGSHSNSTAVVLRRTRTEPSQGGSVLVRFAHGRRWFVDEPEPWFWFLSSSIIYPDKVINHSLILILHIAVVL